VPWHSIRQDSAITTQQRTNAFYIQSPRLHHSSADTRPTPSDLSHIGPSIGDGFEPLLNLEVVATGLVAFLLFRESMSGTPRSQLPHGACDEHVHKNRRGDGQPKRQMALDRTRPAFRIILGGALE